jgi:hypothetical protein
MKASIIIPILLASSVACTGGPSAVDDEAGTTTSPSSTDANDDSDDDATTNDDDTVGTVGTSSSSSSDDDVFVQPDDVVHTDPCDSFAQDCPEGEKCVPYASSGGTWDDQKCVPVLGDHAAGEPCTYAGPVESTDDCDATSWCFDTEGTGEGICHAFCMGTADTPECPPMTTCTISGSGVVNICLPTCDPLLQDCDDGTGCYWTNVAFNCIFIAGDGILPGQPCGFINDCAPGNMCIDGSTLPECAEPACCTSFCDVTLGDAQCDVLPGTVCVPFFEEGLAPEGYEHIGVCTLPP